MFALELVLLKLSMAHYEQGETFIISSCFFFSANAFLLFSTLTNLFSKTLYTFSYPCLNSIWCFLFHNRTLLRTSFSVFRNTSWSFSILGTFTHHNSMRENCKSEILCMVLHKPEPQLDFFFEHHLEASWENCWKFQLLSQSTLKMFSNPNGQSLNTEIIISSELVFQSIYCQMRDNFHPKLENRLWENGTPLNFQWMEFMSGTM